jgi:hypothetical protein
MVKSIIIYKILLASQVFEDSKSQFAFDSIEYITSIILVGIAAIVMMLIPVVLCYRMFVNFYRMKNYNIYDTEIWSFGNTFKLRYLKLHSKFFKNFIALISWNVFSLLYVIFGFKSIDVGLKEYFYFPFYIFDSIMKNDLYNTIYLYRSNGMFMIVITILTFSFYIIGEYVGRFIAEYKIKKEELSFP